MSGSGWGAVAGEDPQSTAVLQEHVARFVDGWLRRLPSTTAIVLYGSYGRGEGAWYRDDRGSLHPYNDFDFCIVGSEKLPHGPLLELKEAVREGAGLRWVDVHQCSIGELQRLKPTIRNYDLKYASHVVYGDARILEHIPEMPPGTLTSLDAEILFFTRLYTFLGSLGPDGLERPVAGEASRFFRNQMAKAVLAVADVLLLQKKAYDASYRARVDRVLELYAEKGDIHGLCQWALEEKLYPTAPDMTAAEVRELYDRVRLTYLREMYTALSWHFRRSVTGPDTIERHVNWTPMRVARRLYWLARYRDRRAQRSVEVALAQGYLVAAWSQRGVNERWVRRASVLLRRADPTLPHGLGWDELRLVAVRLSR